MLWAVSVQPVKKSRSQTLCLASATAQRLFQGTEKWFPYSSLPRFPFLCFFLFPYMNNPVAQVFPQYHTVNVILDSFLDVQRLSEQVN